MKTGFKLVENVTGKRAKLVLKAGKYELDYSSMINEHNFLEGKDMLNYQNVSIASNKCMTTSAYRNFIFDLVLLNIFRNSFSYRI